MGLMAAIILKEGGAYMLLCGDYSNGVMTWRYLIYIVDKIIGAAPALDVCGLHSQ